MADQGPELAGLLGRLTVAFLVVAALAFAVGAAWGSP